MRCFILIIVEIIAMAAAGPVPLDLLFASDFEDLGGSTYLESLYDPLSGESMMDTNNLFSSSDPSNSNGLLYAEMVAGDLPATDQENSLSESYLLDQGDFPVENDLFGQFSLEEFDSDCIPDVMQGIGKIRLGRSCPDLKEAKKSEQKVCVKERSQVCCCTGGNLAGVYNTGCVACMHSSFFA